MHEIIKIIYEVVIGVLAVFGAAFCIYYIIFKRRLYIKDPAYLIIDIDAVNERLEYYIWRINANIKINKIILYSSSGSHEALNICEILARDYQNIKFYKNLDIYF